MVNLVTFIFIWTACKFFKEMEFGLRRRYCALCNVVVDVLTLMICSHSSLSFFSHSFYPRLTPFMLTFWFGIKKKKWLSHLVLLVVRLQCWLIMILVMMCLCHFVVLLSVLDLGSILFLLFPPLFSLLFLLRPFPFSFRSFPPSCSVFPSLCMLYPYPPLETFPFGSARLLLTATFNHRV